MIPHVLLEARREFARGSPERMAKLSGSEYLPDRSLFTLRYMNALYNVSFPDGQIIGDRVSELNQDEEALLLQYLSQASGVPPAGRWVSFAELPNGMLHDSPFRTEAIRPLEQIFDGQPQQLVRAAKQLGGYEIGLAGDVSVAVPVLPRLLLALSLWVGDEEFPARVNILFDAAAPGYFSTAALYVLGSNLSARLQQVAGQE